ncbi:heparan-alpha-glucosaminide N-acetyltransferase domain-containing protein [Microbacterium sp.]|uniref:heparan-alpha-glucosaminide N-acetyltransferase domain-containing protein n=1 Tax=Microbacterium sp. TaxID=51671 RepID=UPI00260C520C|nr:heparan-alpha-glucosaminide N-acetyltransferase domain-containing protein [Microbacterium sp.]
MVAATAVADRVVGNLRRLDGPPRIPGLDLARGLAVIGMLAAHLFTLPEIDWTDPATWGGIAGGRSSILFATLAGVSISIVTTGPRAPREPGRWLAWRALVLWVIGIALILTGVPVYVILPAYAILFAAAIPFVRVRTGALWIWAVAVATVVPWLLPPIEAASFWDTAPGEALFLVTGWAYPAPLWLAFLLAGMAIGRLDLTRVAVLWITAGVGMAVAAVAETLAVVLPAPEDDYLGQVWRASEHSGGILEVWGSGGFAIAIIALCVLVCRTALRALVLPIRTLGAMPLTAYSAQTVVWAVWAFVALGTTSDLFGFRALNPFWPMTLGIIAACLVWALLLGRGPLERLVDRVSRPRADRLAG